jgi:hypothetical protein
MLSVLNTVQQHEKTAVFPVAPIGIPGQRPKNRQKHQNIGKDTQHQIRNGQPGQEQTAYTADHTKAQNPHIQFVAAIAASHKALQSLRKSAGSSGTHQITLFRKVLLLYCIFSGLQPFHGNVYGLFNIGSANCHFSGRLRLPMDNGKCIMDNDCVAIGDDSKSFPKEIPQLSIIHYPFGYLPDKREFDNEISKNRAQPIGCARYLLERNYLHSS